MCDSGRLSRSLYPVACKSQAGRLRWVLEPSWHLAGAFSSHKLIRDTVRRNSERFVCTPVHSLLRLLQLREQRSCQGDTQTPETSQEAQGMWLALCMGSPGRTEGWSLGTQLQQCHGGAGADSSHEEERSCEASVLLHFHKSGLLCSDHG